MKILVSTLSYDGKISDFSVKMFVKMFKSFQTQYNIAFKKFQPDNLKTLGLSTLQTNGINIDLFIPQPDLTNRARVQIINEAIAKGYDMCFMVDEDNPISSVGLIHMLKTMKESRAGVVCAAVPSRNTVAYSSTQEIHPRTGKIEPIVAAVMRSDEGGYKHYIPLREIPARSWIEIDSCGTGCLLIDVGYLEKLVEKYGAYCCEFDTKRHIVIDGEVKETIEMDDGKNYIVEKEGYLGESVLSQVDMSNYEKIISPIGEDVLMVERMKGLGAKIVMDCHVTAEHWNNGSGFSRIDRRCMDMPLEIFVPVYDVTPRIWKCIDDNLYLWRDLFESEGLKVTFIHDGKISVSEKKKFADRIRKKYPVRWEKGRINVVIYAGNRGTNSAWNIAKMSQAMNVLMLNDDCIVSGDTLRIMMETLKVNKEFGVVSPMTKDNNTPNGDGIKIGNIAGRCFMMRSEVCSLVMPIDSRLNLWYGDDWIFHSVKQLGLEVGYIKGTICEHLGSETIGKPGNINKGIAKIIEKDKLGRVSIIKERGRIDNRF